MNISLSKDLREFVRHKVESGQFLSEDAVIEAALHHLRKEGQQEGKRPMTEAEFEQYLLRTGRLSQIPTREADPNGETWKPIAIQGEPLSETILRERR